MAEAEFKKLPELETLEESAQGLTQFSDPTEHQEVLGQIVTLWQKDSRQLDCFIEQNITGRRDPKAHLLDALVKEADEIRKSMTHPSPEGFGADEPAFQVTSTSGVPVALLSKGQENLGRFHS